VGLTPVSDREVASVVTTLEMRARPPLRPAPDAPLRLVRWRRPSRDAYRALFRRVGAPWLWFSRLTMADARLDALLASAATEVYAVEDRAGLEVGMLELDLMRLGECKIAYLGLVPELAGQGLGRWLMHHALTLGWRPGVSRLWVHTCTLDHPRALGFYRASGFVPVKRTVETFPDPRLDGTLPPDAAPHVPLLASRP
jgi:GNAT superfamily N-acetyltransferase